MVLGFFDRREIPKVEVVPRLDFAGSKADLADQTLDRRLDPHEPDALEGRS